MPILVPKHVIDTESFETVRKVFGEKTFTVIKSEQMSNPMTAEKAVGAAYTRQYITEKKITCTVNVDNIFLNQNVETNYVTTKFNFYASGFRPMDDVGFYFFNDMTSGETFSSVLAAYNDNDIDDDHGYTDDVYFYDGDDMIVFGDGNYYPCGYYQVLTGQSAEDTVFMATLIIAYDLAEAEEGFTTQCVKDKRFKALIMCVRLFPVPRDIEHVMTSIDIRFSVMLSVNGKQGEDIYNPIRGSIGPRPDFETPFLKDAIIIYNRINLHDWMEV